MNLQRLPEYLIRWVVTLSGIFLAIYLARSVADGRAGFVAGVLLAIVAIGVVLAVREKIWLLIPPAWALAGQLPGLGLPFTARDLVVLFVFAAFLMLKAFKIVRMKPRSGTLDILAYVLVFYLILSFVRNPVGVEALESDRVGGRPYLICGIGFLAYWILRVMVLRPETSKRLLAGLVACAMLEGVLTQLVIWFPSLGFIGRFYAGGFMDVLKNEGASMDAGTGRLTYLASIGGPVLLYLFVRHPLSALLSPTRFWRVLLVIGGFACVLLSGFRNALLGSLAYFIISGYLHRGRFEIIRIGLLGGLVLLIVAVGNGSVFSLPRSAQRTLSWLPGNWDAFAVQEAKASTKWRTDMWKEMLTTDRYIENKALGDGFGFTRRQLQLMDYFARTGDTAAGQENFMISGNVHSGPVSSIRYGGYVGLLILLSALVLQAREAWRLIHRSWPTPFRTLTLFICIPIVVDPLFFTFVFGAYENAVPQFFFNLGLLRMLQNSIEARQADEHKTQSLAGDFSARNADRRALSPVAATT